ncbi:MAG: cyclic nucleotide-binding domain-containing protein [Cyanobacteriota bacterium]|nr:cyclic nucleotide-binding domain-containing protein [Cyanobacteriota bacterium]
MLAFHAWSEREAHRVRWLLLGVWLLLIASLLAPAPGLATSALGMFWQVGVPLVLLVLVVLSHEAWRRLCPLAFVSQLARSLGWQRSVLDARGRPSVARVAPSGWLARHHIRLQWGLFLAGLSLRLLLLNQSPRWLAVFLLATLAAALLVGWAWAGKAWCQYICPMAPVQAILVGPRSLLGSSAHLAGSGQITQSTCRSIGPTGQVQRACVGCQKDCIDIDSELSFWEGLRGKPGLAWAWYSYPGVVIAFLLLQRLGPAQRAWAPLLLLGAGWLSVVLLRAFREGQQRRLHPRLAQGAPQRADQITRLLATFIAVNAFFGLSEPHLVPQAAAAMPAVRMLVLAVSAVWLYRGLRRNQGHYARERISASLRLQLQKLVPDLASHLDGRRVEDLGADEVVTLAKVLPAQWGASRLAVYRGVVADLLRSGRLTRAAALLQLTEVRRSLQLSDDDHHTVLRELAITERRLLELDDRQGDLEELRREAAREAVQDLLALHPDEPPAQVLARPSLQSTLERIRREQGFDDDAWEELLEGFTAGSGVHRRWLAEAVVQLEGRLEGLESLRRAAATDPLLAPLVPVQERTLASLLTTLLPPLQALPADDPLPCQVAGLLPALPLRLQRQLAGRLPGLLPGPSPSPVAAGDWASSAPLPVPAAVVDSLWLDPDPDTALWVLWLQDRREPQRAAALRQRARPGRPSHPELQGLLAGRPLQLEQRLLQLLQVPLLAGLPPATLLAMARCGAERRLVPEESLFQVGDPADGVAILVQGRCQVLRALGNGVFTAVAELEPGETIGELAFFSSSPRRSEVRAAAGGATLLCFEGHEFEMLLLMAPEFSRELLAQLALRLEAIYARLGPADHRASTAGLPAEAPL